MLKISVNGSVLCPIAETKDMSKCSILVGNTITPEFMKSKTKDQENEMIV